MSQLVPNPIPSQPSLTVPPHIATEIENIVDGVFYPLQGFLCQNDYRSVLFEKRLSNDRPWTIPIVLDTDEKTARKLSEGDDLHLFDPTTESSGFLQVEEVFKYDKSEFAKQVYGTVDPTHPGVARTFAMGDFLVGGKVKLAKRGSHSLSEYSLTPQETRVLFKEKGWKTIVGFQTRNVPHVGHEYVQKTALTFCDGIFINPVVGPKKEGDFKDEVIVEAYSALVRNYYLKERAVLAVLRNEMHYAGPREAVLHAIIRKNFGCTHFVVGRDHAGVGKFYGPYAAQEIFEEFPDLGIVPLFFTAFFYCTKCGGVASEKTCPHSPEQRVEFSGTRLRESILKNERLPVELIRPEVSEIIMGFKDPFVSSAQTA